MSMSKGNSMGSEQPSDKCVLEQISRHHFEQLTKTSEFQEPCKIDCVDV